MNERKVLIADDSPLILRTLEFRLKAAGYKVMTAKDPSEAFEKVRADHPDVIIMDINFPPDVGFGGGGTWDGFRALEWMKVNKTLGKAAEIIITGDDLDRHRDRADAAGVSGLFKKPVDIDALVERIEDCLRQMDSDAMIEKIDEACGELLPKMHLESDPKDET